MRAAALLVVPLVACASGLDRERGAEPSDASAHDATASDADGAAARVPTLREGLALFFPLDESGDSARMDRVSSVALVPWQRTGFGQYAVDGRGTTAVAAAVSTGQHVLGSEGYHFATPSTVELHHAGGSFTWAGWVSIDAPDTADPYTDPQTWLAKWNGIPDTFAPNDHREYRVWYEQSPSRWRFEVSADGLEGARHSRIVTHPASIERDQLYFLEAWHDAELATISLRISTRTERGTTASESWSDGVFLGDADLDVGAQNTCTDAHLQGIVDALGYWNRALTDDESAALWNAGVGLEL